MLFAILAGVAALMLLPGLLLGPSLDAAVFTHAAGELGNGAALYADVWDHKPPGVYLLLAGPQLALFFVNAWWVSWVLSVLATAGAGTALAIACRRMGASPEATLVASIAGVVAMSQYLLALGGGLTEPFATLPVAVALVMVLKPGAAWSPRQLAVIGLLLSVAVLTSLQLIPGALGVTGILLARLPRSGRLPAGAWIVGAGLVPVVAIVAWLVATGAFGAAVDALVGYSAAYRALRGDADQAGSTAVVTWTLLSLLFLIVPALLGAMTLARRQPLDRVVLIACGGWIGLSILLFVFQGRFYAHYAVPLAVPLALLASAGVDRLDEMLLNTSQQSRQAMILAPFAFAILVSLWGGVAAGRMEWLPIARDHDRSTAVAEVVRELTDDGGRIWVWGNEPTLYLDADRRQATRYPYLYPIVTQGYATPEMIDATIAALETDPPALVIDAGSDTPGSAGFHHLIIPRALATDGRDLDILDPLREYIDANYEYVDVVEGWVIYERVAP